MRSAGFNTCFLCAQTTDDGINRACSTSIPTLKTIVITAGGFLRQLRDCKGNRKLLLSNGDRKKIGSRSITESAFHRPFLMEPLALLLTIYGRSVLCVNGRRTKGPLITGSNERLAIIFLQNGRSRMVVDECRQLKINKCSESMWKFTYYATVQIWVISILHQSPWSLHTKEYFKGWPNQELWVSMKLFYMCQCGFYIYSIGALLIWETRRKDFSIMMSHHIITSILIWISYITRFFRIGIVILALHDTCDVFLEAAKVFKYSEKEMGASIGFVCFAISWLLLRLVFFPVWLIKASSYYSVESLQKGNFFPRTLYYTFNTLLIMLLVFHIYWWKLICAMIMKQLRNRGKVGEDIRSDSEDEE